MGDASLSDVTIPYLFGESKFADSSSRAVNRVQKFLNLAVQINNRGSMYLTIDFANPSTNLPRPFGI
jgi:hypothetical protein